MFIFTKKIAESYVSVILCVHCRPIILVLQYRHAMCAESYFSLNFNTHCRHTSYQFYRRAISAESFLGLIFYTHCAQAYHTSVIHVGLQCVQKAMWLQAFVCRSMVHNNAGNLLQHTIAAHTTLHVSICLQLININLVFFDLTFFSFNSHKVKLMQSELKLVKEFRRKRAQMQRELDEV